VEKELYRDIGQLCWIGFGGTSLTVAERKRLQNGRAGGAILFARNLMIADGVCELAHVASLCKELHDVSAAADEPALVSIDHEGGLVQRIRKPLTVWPPMIGFDAMPAARAVAAAEAVARAMAKELFALGLDIDFAPVLDVHTNPKNPIIGNRAFSTDAQRVAERAVAFSRAMMAEGILPCGKHFPGHGDTDLDSHLALPRLQHDMARLEKIELVPFRAAIEADIPMIMTAHVVFQAIEPQLPATMSPLVLEKLLRKKLRFQGLIISDDLDMKAIALHYQPEEAAVRAIGAGCDVLLLCKDPESQDRAFEGLVRAAEAKSDFRQRVTASAGAIRRLKKKHFAGRQPKLAALRPEDAKSSEAAGALARELSGA
jgi:beta-N-acetylhexosaminidase